MLIECTCDSKYQDGKHGLKKRVHNPMKSENMYRCVVCKKERGK